MTGDRPPRLPRLQVLFLALAALAFGYIEGAVVVYLRAVAYPAGFAFPLAEMDPFLVATEIGREAATLLLLLGLAWLAAPDGKRRFAAFALAFAVWDLAYYATLKGLLGWPASWLDWDILFLIPAPWVAPVLAPILVSAALAGAALAWLLPGPRGAPRLRARDWIVEISAGALVLASFFAESGPVTAGEAPGAYPWWLFAAGWGLGVAWFLRVSLRRV
ncbi:MAG: hypothetical protein JW819_02330 [Candidatus Krumholzibacteriota bacterium]|nr:hypothetical protein [Candidatus Krumholzibacteriota bacterium]